MQKRHNDKMVIFSGVRLAFGVHVSVNFQNVWFHKTSSKNDNIHRRSRGGGLHVQPKRKVLGHNL